MPYNCATVYCKQTHLKNLLSSNIGTVRAGFLRWWMRWCEVVECEVLECEVVEVRWWSLRWWMSTTSFIISIQYVIILCNDVTRASLNKVGQNLLTTHFLASLHVCDTIEGLMSICYDWRFEDFFTFTDVVSVPISNI
jgi:hypothetical protein